MALNLGYTEQRTGSGVIVRVFYDETFTPVGEAQPLVDAPVGKDYGNGVIGRGLCLDLTNLSGRNVRVDINGQAFTVGQGDPVTSGNGRSRTAAQMATLGFATRGDLQNLNVQ